MKLTQRAAAIGESATLKVARRAGELRTAGVDVVDLSAGEPDFPSPPVAVEAAIAALRAGRTRYAPAAGLPELRAALAARYRDGFEAPWEGAQCAVTVGAKAALFQLILALVEPGDEVVLPAPYWVSFPEQIRFAGGRPRLVPTSAADGFRVTAAPLVEAMTPATRMVVVNSPSNPTGGLMPAAELAALAAACAERGVLLLSDETYERFVYAPEGHASAAALAARHPETIVLVGSFSKTYAMTGWRVGYALGPPAVISALTKIQSHSTSNVTTFAMVGALAALEGAEADVEAMLAEYRRRRELVVERLAALEGVDCAPPDGAFYVFPGVRRHYGPGRADSVEFAAYLLDEARVAVVPGRDFGDDDCVRLSFACSLETLEDGLGRLARALG